LGSFSKIVWANFSEKVVFLNLAKYGLVNILGDFFSKASGHPGQEIC
jgi:hypothetical protein